MHSVASYACDNCLITLSFWLMGNKTHEGCTPVDVKKVIEHFGGAVPLGKWLGITRQAVEDWQAVPVKHCPRISAASHWSLEELRPDVFEVHEAQITTAPEGAAGSLTPAKSE